jgi:hypothetical protein
MPIHPDALDSKKRHLNQLAGDLTSGLAPAPVDPVTFYVVQHFNIPLELGWCDVALAEHATLAKARRDLRRAASWEWVKKATDRPLRIVKRTITIVEEDVT